MKRCATGDPTMSFGAASTTQDIFFIATQYDAQSGYAAESEILILLAATSLSSP